MAHLFSLQQSILKSYGGNVSIGLDLTFHQKYYDYDKVIRKIERKNIPAVPFPYEINKRYPVKILSDVKASQIAVNMLAMQKVTNSELLYYPIKMHWHLLANRKTKTLSMWTASLKYTQDFLNDLEVAASGIFTILTSSPYFYTIAERVNVVDLIRNITDARTEKVEPMTMEVMRGGKIIPLKISQPYYAISSLPQGERVYIVITTQGVYTLAHQVDLELTTVKLMTKDTTFLNDDDLPCVLMGYEISPRNLINGGIQLKGLVYVVNDCLMRSGVSNVNKDLFARLQLLNNIKVNITPDNEILNLIIPMQREARTPRSLFTTIQEVLSKRDGLFYRSGGLIFRQIQGYSRHTSYEWREAFPVTTLLSMNTHLLENYHEREKKHLLNFPSNTLKKSMVLFDMSGDVNLVAWETYYKIYSSAKSGTVDPRVIFSEPVEKVHVIYAEHLEENELSIIDEKLLEGGFLVLKIVEKELLHAALVSYPQYNDMMALPDPSLGEIKLTGVKIDEKFFKSTALKPLINKFNIIQNYILDKEVVLNSTEEHLTKVFSGVILRKGETELKDLKPPLHKEIKAEVIEKEYTPIPEVVIPQEPTPESIETATPVLPMPLVSSVIVPLARGPGYKPMTIIPGAASRREPPVSKAPRAVRRAPIISCQSLEVGERRQQWQISDMKITRFGSIGDGSCLIHAILTAVNDDYPMLNKDKPGFNEKVKLAKQIARKEREKLAEGFTKEIYDTYDFSQLEQPNYSYESMKKRLKSSSTFIEHEIIDYISNFYDINIMFFTCANDKEAYVRYKEGRTWKDYPDRDWILILWVEKNHFEIMGNKANGSVLLFFDHNDEIIKDLFK